jgi:hypothetical protein
MLLSMPAPTLLSNSHFERALSASSPHHGGFGLWRAVVTLTQFPVAFRSSLDAAAFWLAAYFLLFYVTAPDIWPLSLYLKYLFSISIIVCCIFLTCVRQTICLSSVFLLGPLLLSLAGAASFGQAIMAGGGNTYSSALVPLVIVSAPLFVPQDNSYAQGRSIVRYLLVVFGTGAAFHVVWQVAGRLLGISEVEGEAFPSLPFAPRYFAASSIILYFAILVGFFRRNTALAFATVLAVISLLLRPSSTLAFSSILVLGAIFSYRLGLRRLFRFAAWVLLIIIMLGNVAILLSDEFARAVYSLEPYVKSDVLESTSNNEFRLGVTAAARTEMQETSIWIGQAFSGDMDVSVNRYLTWYDKSEAPIHSDFLTIIVQGGLIGFALFSSLFLGLAGLCWRGARLSRAVDEPASETLFDALLGIDVVFAIYISFNPIMQLLPCVLPFFLTVPLAVFLSRSLTGAPAAPT